MQKTGKVPPRIKFPVLINRWVSFLFLMSLLIIFLYLAGSIHDFMDSTQLFLLKLCSFLGLFLTVAASCGLFHGVFLFCREKSREKAALIAAGKDGVPKRKNRHVRYIRYLTRRMVFHLIFVIFGVLSALTAVLILALSGGNIA